MKVPSAGTLLVAEPFLRDPNFIRAVVLICDHQEEGSFGFVINRSFDQTLDELMPELEGMTLPVYDGGPVQRDTLHFLHQCPEQIPGSLEIADGVFWGGDFNRAIKLLQNQSIMPAMIRFFIGYSGWSGGQLENELREKSWLLTPARVPLVFPRKVEEVWKDSIRDLGDDYAIMLNLPIDPSLN